MKPDTEKVLSILASHENDPSNLIAILQDVQALSLIHISEPTRH